jgi:threonine/homoserine/homoserine lactone efflux protein
MDALSIFGEGVLFGIVPVFFVGPVLFTLIHASLRDGFAAGAAVAAGIAVSDVVAVGLCAVGVGTLLTASWGQSFLGVAGGLILLGFGAVMVFGKMPERRARPARFQGARHFAAGFLVNFVNPFVFAFWIGALGVVSSRHGFEPAALVWFFGGTITTILVTDLLKARLAAALERHMSGPVVRVGQRVSGALLGGFGIYLLGSALWSLRQAT